MLDQTMPDSEMRLGMLNWIFLCFLMSPADDTAREEWMDLASSGGRRHVCKEDQICVASTVK